ncbi:Transcriptional regulator SlyA [Corynebacterium urogenitale]|uniref:Transcriptional regulator SlyA n=1 Tax=Corynebacterium urogenitale TaxID=2487892 RepID=A0A5J6Z8U7_9CORY|nr:MarR family winged helix-turn-helix transcriptional regulator [Corynebacterium urogenitale]QFQ03396.1 Transcriptional regulator SlyA [Corynebacterium urogenitale]
MPTPTTPKHTSEETPWLSDQEQATWRAWLLVSRRLDAQLARELQQESSISYADYAVLVHLSEHPDKRYRIAALAETLDWDRSRLSHQITRMAKRGLVRRETCSQDGRGAFVAIEDEGMRIIEEAAPGHVQSVRRHVFDLLSAQDQKDLLRIMDTLAAQFMDEDTAEESAQSGGC